MGLSLVHTIVDNLGGSIKVESKIGEGTAFHILFPKIENDVEETLEDCGPIAVGHERVCPETCCEETNRAHERITLQSLGAEAPGWQGAKAQEYLDIPRFSNAARRDASADKM